jgi:hypothetical protein
MTPNARAFVAGVLLAASAPLLAQSPAPEDNWEGLVRVRSEKIEFVYLAPEADFRPYTKVMLDPSEMAMEKDWSLQPNGRDSAFRREADASQVFRALERARKRLDRSFADVFGDAGFTIVRSPGADVVRVRVGVFDIDVQTPDGAAVTTTRTKTLSENAGRATLVVEVRDSVSNALLGRAIERRIAGDNGPWLRTSASNRADFDRLFRRWAEASAEGLVELKALSPVDVNGERLAR